MATLLIAEVANGALNDITARALTAAVEIGAGAAIRALRLDVRVVRAETLVERGQRVALDWRLACLGAWPRRAAGRADRFAGPRLRRDSRRLQPVLEELPAARRRSARRDAGLRHHQGRRPQDLRASDLRRQCDPDRGGDRRQGHRHRAHRLLPGDGRRRLGADRERFRRG